MGVGTMHERHEHLRQTFVKSAERGVLKLAIIEATPGNADVVIYPRSGLHNEPEIRANDSLLCENGGVRQYRVYASTDELAHYWTNQADLAAKLLGIPRGWRGWADLLLDHVKPIRRTSSEAWWALMEDIGWRSAELLLDLSKPETPEQRQSRLFDEWYGRSGTDISQTQFARDKAKMGITEFQNMLKREKYLRDKSDT